MKKLILCVLALGLNACSSGGSGSSTTGNPTSSYSSCEQVPNVTLIGEHNCPGSSSTWNNYEVKKDSSGTVVSVELWCGGTDQDHPSNQSEYDTYMIPGGSISNADYKSGTDCVSGSNSSASETIVNIWQKK